MGTHPHIFIILCSVSETNRIQVSDGVHVVSRQVEYEIIDVNDNSPKFKQDFLEVSIGEDSPIDSTIVQLKAIDFDSGDSGRVAHRLIGNEEGEGKFAIDENNGNCFFSSGRCFNAIYIVRVFIGSLDNFCRSSPWIGVIAISYAFFKHISYRCRVNYPAKAPAQWQRSFPHGSSNGLR
jgi:hypothetical protein